MMFFVIEKDDSESKNEISEGVKEFAQKYTFVWIDIKEYDPRFM